MTKQDQKFIQEFEKKVATTINKHNLIQKKDKLLVAASGGKDSTVLLYILSKLKYNVKAITLNAFIGNYSKENLENLRKFCSQLSIELKEISLRKEFGYSLCYIISLLKSKGQNMNSCAVCGVMRRYLLNKAARKLKATKIATGHNLDDEAQNIMMNFLRKTHEKSLKLGPMTGFLPHKKFVPRIKPLYFCTEQEIIKYAKLKKFPVNFSPCPCRIDAYRKSVLDMLDNLEKNKQFKNIKQNIVNNFLKLLPELRKNFTKSRKKKELGNCENCGEPAKNKLCRACEIIELLKNN